MIFDRAHTSQFTVVLPEIFSPFTISSLAIFMIAAVLTWPNLLCQFISESSLHVPDMVFTWLSRATFSTNNPFSTLPVAFNSLWIFTVAPNLWNITSQPNVVARLTEKKFVLSSGTNRVSRNSRIPYFVCSSTVPIFTHFARESFAMRTHSTCGRELTNRDSSLHICAVAPVSITQWYLNPDSIANALANRAFLPLPWDVHLLL